MARAVEIVKGPRFAAAYGEISYEGLIQALQRGYLIDGRVAARLHHATVRFGKAVPYEHLVGLDSNLQPLPPTGSDADSRSSKPTASAARLRIARHASQAPAVAEEREQRLLGTVLRRSPCTPHFLLAGSVILPFAAQDRAA